MKKSNLKKRRDRNQKVGLYSETLQLLKRTDPPKLENQYSHYLTASRQEEGLKKRLMKRLQKYSAAIDEIPQQINITKDEVALNLLDIEVTSKRKQFKIIQQEANMLLGKRLIKLEIELKRREHMKKLDRKEKIEQQFFRQKRIKNFDYKQLIRDKLKENTLIVRPYANGKGFIESDIYEVEYENGYANRLQECGYIQVAKQVNQIIMKTLSYGSAHSNKDSFPSKTVGLAAFLAFCLVIFVFLEINDPSQYSECTIYTLSSVLLFNILIPTIINYIKKPNDNDQSQQSYEQVTNYLQTLNQKNKQEGKKFTWSFPKNFMYLQVHFEEELSSCI